mmetsp:Transcript_31919/g.93807  ORF Transcript_31919/g.93807 Transcript_31919/m.93807 type:complete len:86 (-) Transcript_31919:907-1164(-)
MTEHLSIRSTFLDRQTQRTEANRMIESRRSINLREREAPAFDSFRSSSSSSSADSDPTSTKFIHSTAAHRSSQVPVKKKDSSQRK